MQAGTSARGLARLVRWWRLAVSDPVLSVLFPPRCVSCGDFETYLCEPCREGLKSAAVAACPRCGEPGLQTLVTGRCAACMGKELAYVGARGAFLHQGAARDLVTSFKFGGQPVLGRLMAELAAPGFADYIESIGSGERSAVTWVPCHRAARRERGYNQAEVLARALASVGRPLCTADLVRKARVTRHQKALGRTGRQQNLRGVFVLDQAASTRLEPGTEALVLVDDVLTTGATAGEVASVLVKGTGLPVYVFTFSRAVAGTPERHD